MKKIIALLLLLLPVSAFAHAFPVAYSPDGFSMNPTMPSEVMIHFSQGILLTGNGIEVFAPDGTKLPPVDALVDMHGEHTLSRGITARGDGIYVISWNGVSSEDGHFTRGAFSFFVGATSSAPEFYGGSVGGGGGASQFPFMKPSGLFALASLMIDHIAVFALLIWVGSILIFTVLYLPFLASKESLPPLRAVLRMMLGRIFAWALLFGGASGVLSVWMHLKSWDNLTTTAWGATLITPVLFLGVLFGLRLLSIFVLERMKRCIHCEWAYALLESGIGLCALFFVVLLVVTPSPIYNSKLWSVTRMDASRMITVTDLGGGEGALRLRAFSMHGAPIATSLPTVLLDNAKEGIGPLVIPVKDRGDGNYDIPEALFTPRGEWRIAITFKQEGAYDINTTIGIDYPREILAARTKALTPRFGMFEVSLMVLAFALFGLSLLVFLFVKRNNAFAVLHPEYDMDPISIGARKAIMTACIAFLSIIAVIVLLRMFLPFCSEEIHHKTIPMQMNGMSKGMMDGMQM